MKYAKSDKQQHLGRFMEVKMGINQPQMLTASDQRFQDTRFRARPGSRGAKEKERTKQRKRHEKTSSPQGR